jgi:phosphocarrier protein
MQQREIEIVNTPGLNAAAATKFTQLASKYECEVSLTRNGRRVNGKSLMGVMMLAAGKGSRVVLETDGPDETEALNAIVALVGDNFAQKTE